MTIKDECDVAVVGGGIHGVGVAQAAAAAGYDAIVIEQTALAAGTSSRSSKLIHGGLRYLESRQFRLVRASLRERELLLRLAPELVRRVPFYIPVYPNTRRRPWLLRMGLTAYGVLAGGQRHVWFRKVPRREWCNLDGLRTDRLQCVFQYWDAQADDRQLTHAVMSSAQTLGARLWCPTLLVSAEVQDQHCLLRCQSDDSERQLVSKVIVNAAGPWANRLLERFHPTIPAMPVENVQGTHLELTGAVDRGCYYVESPTDRRAVLVMPWYDRTLLGTTEEVFAGDPATVKPTRPEIDYLIATYSHFFPNRSNEILDAWAGLRVLPKTQGTAFGRSRETQLPTDHPTRPRVVSIFGGKLTAYRATAGRVMKLLSKTLPSRKRRAVTTELPLTPTEFTR